MSSPADHRRMSVEDYLAWEAAQPTRHEYVAGDVFAMAGASANHGIVALNVASLLRNHVRGTPCRTFIADMKLRVEAADAFFYPDVMVICDERDRGATHVMRHPTLVVEVLSESTATYDRDQKFEHYRTLESLQEYVLIHPDRVSVDVFRRDASGHWMLHPFRTGDEVELASLGFRAPIAAVYEDVALPPRSQPTP